MVLHLMLAAALAAGDVERRVNGLLARMTLDEKIGQTVQDSSGQSHIAACLKHYVGYGAASGGRGGSEVVQIYVRDRIASVTRLVRELKGYVRVELKPGESRRVAVEVPFSAFAFHCDGKLVAGKGSFDAWIASDSASGRQIGFELHLSREDFLQHKKGER